MDTLVVAALIIMGILLLLVLALLLVLVVRRPQDISPFVSPVQNLTQSIGTLQSELRGLAERVHARQAMDQQTADSIRRLEAIIAGTQTKGVAGENIVELVFSQLPPEWQVRNFQVGNKVVEFGLRLPNNLILPIDSKWAATNLLEQFLASRDISEQQQLKAQIAKTVLGKVKEVRRYIEPNVTVNFAIAAVPDAVFDLCSAVQGEALLINVVLLPYSMFVPYLLLAFQTILRTSQEIDLQKLAAYLESAQNGLNAIQEELEGRFSRALIMLGNSRDDMRSQLSRISTGLASFQLGARGSTSASEFLPPIINEEPSNPASEAA